MIGAGMGIAGGGILPGEGGLAGATGRLGTALAALVLAVCGSSSEALAHASDRGHVLLLPTGYYLTGGAAAVALSFIVLAFVPARPVERLFAWRLGLGTVPVSARFVLSALSFLALTGLIAAGFLGSRDPLSNPLPLVVWTLFWVGLTLVQGLFGNLWWWINPWYAPWRVLALLFGIGPKPGALPGGIGYWPAVLLFFAFAWFELVYPAPDDPERLAVVVTLYFLVNLAAMLAHGHEAWSRQGECLSVFLGMVARLGIVEAGPEQGGRRGLALRLPGAKLVDAPGLPPSGTLFLLLALASVSFDGLMRTFFWLGLNGVNPLEFPGRTAVIGIGTWGLAAMAAALACAFFLAVAIGERLAGARGPTVAAGRLVWSIIPISIAYHFSHYLVALVINGQYAVAALADPFATGGVFGTAAIHVQAGALSGAEGAWLAWNLQAGAIVAGHLLAVLVAHAIALRLHSGQAAARSQVALAALMVLYTVFGLWLLSAPTAG